MKELLNSYCDYNVWANTAIIQTLSSVSPEIIDKHMGGSFPTIRKTLYHIWDAQVIWLTRLQGSSPSDWPSAMYDDEFAGYDLYFIQQSEDFARFVSSRPEDFFGDMCFYKALNGQEYQTRNGEIILHCMNHGSYHRGQIINYLRMQGVSDLPHTDYIFYSRAKQS